VLAKIQPTKPRLCSTSPVSWTGSQTHLARFPHQRGLRDGMIARTRTSRAVSTRSTSWEVDRSALPTPRMKRRVAHGSPLRTLAGRQVLRRIDDRTRARTTCPRTRYGPDGMEPMPINEIAFRYSQFARPQLMGYSWIEEHVVRASPCLERHRKLARTSYVGQATSAGYKVPAK
jgi:hypothetical protein